MTYMIEIFLIIVCFCGCFMMYAECDGCDCDGDYNNKSNENTSNENTSNENTSNENTSTECEISVVKSPIADAQLENA